MDAQPPRRRRRPTAARRPARERQDLPETTSPAAATETTPTVSAATEPDLAPESAAAAEFAGSGGRLDLLPLGMAAGIMALLAVCVLLALAAA